MTAPLQPLQLDWSASSKAALLDFFNAKDYDLAKTLGELGTRSEFRQRRQARPLSVPATGSDPLAAMLFDARASAKSIAASLSMHLPTDWRLKVYRQIDELLEAAEWDKDAGLLDARTMRTFLRFVIFANVSAVPALGLSGVGNMVAAWRRDTRRLTMEFLPDDLCRLAISHFTGGDPSIFTFYGKVATARDYLKREFPSLG